MTIPEFLAWQQHGAGAWWASRLRGKWAIEAAVQQRELAAMRDRSEHPTQWDTQGMRGGYTDPREQCTFDDGDEEDAA